MNLQRSVAGCPQRNSYRRGIVANGEDACMRNSGSKNTLHLGQQTVLFAVRKQCAGQSIHDGSAALHLANRQYRHFLKQQIPTVGIFAFMPRNNRIHTLCSAYLPSPARFGIFEKPVHQQNNSSPLSTRNLQSPNNRTKNSHGGNSKNRELSP